MIDNSSRDPFGNVAASIADLLEGDLEPEAFTRQLVQINLIQARAIDPMLPDVLRACAIPRFFDTEIVGILRDAPEDGEVNERLLAALRSFSFVKERAGGGYIYHDNVREVLLEEWNEPAKRTLFETLVRRLGELYKRRGKERFEQMQFELALADFHAAIELAAGDDESYYWRGRVHYSLQDYIAALADFNHASELRPDDEKIYKWRGRAHYSLKNYAVALVDLSRAIELEPDNSDNYQWRGAVHYELQDYRAALADFNRAIELEPENDYNYYLRGLASYELQDYTAAYVDLHRTIDLQSDNDSNKREINTSILSKLIRWVAQLAMTDKRASVKPSNELGLTTSGREQGRAEGPPLKPHHFQGTWPNLNHYSHNLMRAADQRQGIFISGEAIVTGTTVGSYTGTIIIDSTPEIEPPTEPVTPPRVENFVGRAAEIYENIQRLAKEHLAVIIGMAGIGKTALAAELASRFGEPGKIFWHSFHEDEGVDAIITRLAGFLAWQGFPDLWHIIKVVEKTGGKLPSPEELLDTLIHMLRGRGYLLCLDDFQFVDRNPLIERFVRHLLSELHTNSISLIITSRRIPTFAQTSEFEPLAGLTIEDTAALLSAHGLVLPEPLMTELHTSMAGNPMLLTLAIGLLDRSAEPSSLISRLAQSQDIVRYLMDEVRANLTDDESAVMCAVAVLLGEPGTRGAIEEILDRGGTWDALHSLSERYLLSVVEMNPDDPIGTSLEGYLQHSVVRDFYYTRVLGRRDRQVMHRRAAAYYEDATNVDHDVLRAARHFECAGNAARAADLALTDISSAFTRGQVRQLRELLERLLLAPLDAERRIALNMAAGRVYVFLREPELAAASFREALAQLDLLPDSPSVRERKANVCCSMGELLLLLRPSEALSWLERGLMILAEVDADIASPTQRLEEARLRLTIGAVHNSRGEYAAAIEEIKGCLALLPAPPSQLHGSAFMNLGNCYFGRGDLHRAREYYLQAQVVYEQLHNYWQITTLQINLATITEALGDWEGSMTNNLKALDLAERLGNVADQVLAVLNLGNLLMKRGNFTEALMYLQKCISIAREHALTYYSAFGLSTMADLYVRQEQWGDARLMLIEAEKVVLEADAISTLPEIHRSSALIELAEGNLHAALEAAMRALHAARTLEDPREEGMSLRVLGCVEATAGRREQASQSLDQSLALLEDLDPYESARTRLVYGELLVRWGEKTQGHELLVQAREIFRQLGAEHDLQQSQRLMDIE